MTIMDTEIPMLKPNETYVYLGMHVSLMLLWHKNSKSITARVLAKLAVIRSMRQDPALVLRTTHGDGCSADDQVHYAHGNPLLGGHHST